jgi:hypothetical protein
MTPRAMKFMITSIVVVYAQIMHMLMISVNIAAVSCMKAIKIGENLSMNKSL